MTVLLYYYKLRSKSETGVPNEVSYKSRKCSLPIYFIHKEPRFQCTDDDLDRHRSPGHVMNVRCNELVMSFHIWFDCVHADPSCDILTGLRSCWPLLCSPFQMQTCVNPVEEHCLAIGTFHSVCSCVHEGHGKVWFTLYLWLRHLFWTLFFHVGRTDR